MRKTSLAVLAGLASVFLGPAIAAADTGTAVRCSIPIHRRDGFQQHCGAALIDVTALTPAIIRVRIGRSGNLSENASWAVASAIRNASIDVRATADGFATAGLSVHGDPVTGALTVADPAGRVVVADAARPFSVDGTAFTLRKLLPPDEHIYGLGDKTGGTLDRRGHGYVDWNTDSYKFDSSTDPIYKSIPFFVSVGGAGGSYGLLLDNTWRTWFDFGHRTANETTMGAPDGPIDYYIIVGPATRDVVRRYTHLTGKAPLPPEWALGYQQSRYSYMSATEVRQLAATFRADRFPLDVLWLDIGFQDRNRPFTVDRATYPDLRGLAADMRGKGIRLVTIADLHVADAPDQGYAPYDTGIQQDAFVHKPDGSIYVGRVWPGASVFPDFTDAKVRRWWGTNFAPFVDDGIAGFWNDMNEPSVFDGPGGTMPLDVVHHLASDDFRTRDASHAEIHNVYGMENSRATFEGLKALRSDERPFVMTRASYAGGQRYAVTWTGDNSSTWDHLRLAVHQLLNLGLSGFAYAGADVGGYTGSPSPALMTRWFEIAAFTPIFRDHSEKGSPRAEPWLDGPTQLAIRRRFVDTRYRLLPYFYALADDNARTGDPLMRPLFYDYASATDASCDQSMDFTLGSALLVAPPPKMESPRTYKTCLPAGGWYDFWTGARVSAEDGASLQMTQTPRLDTLPVFVRAGTILPRQPLVQSTAQLPSGPLSIDVYPGPDCNGTVYLDDGHSMAFARGHFLRQRITCRRSANGGLQLNFAVRDGDFNPWWTKLTIDVHDPANASIVTTSHGRIAARYDRRARQLRFTVPDTLVAGGTVISINPGNAD